MRAVADDNTVYRAIKYRVYPTDAQSEKLSQTFGCARKVYNDALSMQRGLYEAGMPTFGQTALNAYCNRVWKDEYPLPYGSRQVCSHKQPLCAMRRL